jgi:hypothetical protein
MYVEVASPIQVEETREQNGYNVNKVYRRNTAEQDSFGKYLNEKLTHLRGKDISILESVL